MPVVIRLCEMRYWLGMVMVVMSYLGGQLAGQSEFQVGDLRCEYLVEPICLDIEAPRLSWKLVAPDGRSYGLRQTAYRVCVASSQDKLVADELDIWDSGMVASEQSVHVRYQGTPLISGKKYWWRVAVRDHLGQEVWSGPSHWRMGLMHGEDWIGAKWLTLGDMEQPSPDAERKFQRKDMEKPVLKRSYTSGLFRREFEIDRPIRTAMAWICGLGYYELSINGHKVSDHVLDPGQTSYDRRAFYVGYDVTSLLKKGWNAIGALTGNGFYGQTIGFTPALGYNKPCLILRLQIEYEDDSTQTIVTDEQWRATTSPIVYDNVYAGETWDARLEQPGWNRNGFDAQGWQIPRMITRPTQKLEAQKIEPCRMVKTIAPVDIRAVKEGWIIDLGQNIAGWMAIRVQEKAGTHIICELAEHLAPDGQLLDHASTGVFATGVIQQDIYVCKGEGIECWQPRFTYHGFRYALVKGLSRKPQPGDFNGVLVHTDLERVGQFQCNHALLNQEYDVSLWTIVDNLHSIPEDCPHREKCGWLGDAHCTAVADIYNFDMARFFNKYMLDIETVLGRGGETYLHEKATPGIPCNIAPGKRLCQEARVDWGAAIVLIPWYLQLYYGDDEVWQYHYPHMKRWIEYVQRYKKDGIIENGYGDWCPPGTNSQMECPPYLTSTVIYARAVQIAGDFARRRGENDFSQWCIKEYDELVSAFYREYIKPIDGQDALTCGSQTGNAIALALGVIKPEDRDKVGRGLVYDIEVRHQGHISTGIHGSRYLYSVLCDLGYDELAWKLLTRKDYPSLGYVLARGLTTWPEVMIDWPEGQSWSPNSYNHPMQSGFAAFFHERVGGIVPDEAHCGFKQFSLKPCLYQQLEQADVSFESIYGTISSRWTSKAGRFNWQITVPANTRSMVYIPAIDSASVQINDKLLLDTEKKEFVRVGDYVRLTLPAGCYRINSIIEKQ